MCINKNLLRTGILLMVMSLLFVSCMTPAGYQPVGSTPHTITVNGVGVVESEPDAARLNITISELRDTTSEAQSVVNRKIASVLEICEALGVTEEQISTTSINFNAEYDWTDNGRVLKGQRVRQTLTIEVPGIDEDTKLIPSLFDGLGKVAGIEISSLNFYVEDTQSLYGQARELAFGKARQKASEYAAYGEVNLGSPITISEYSNDYSVADNYARGMKVEAAMADYYPSQVPTGSYSVSVTVNVQFKID